MAHKIYMFEPRHEISKTDVTFVVQRGKRKLGELKVSKGSLDWYTGNGRTRYSISWELFDEIMTKGGSIK
jgi:hypothetical protein